MLLQPDYFKNCSFLISKSNRRFSCAHSSHHTLCLSFWCSGQLFFQLMIRNQSVSSLNQALRLKLVSIYWYRKMFSNYRALESLQLDKWIDSSSLCLLRQRNQSLLSEYTIMLDLTGCVKDRNFWDLSDHSALPLCQINLTKSTAKNLILSTLLQISRILPNCLFVGSLCTKILQG